MLKSVGIAEPGILKDKSRTQENYTESFVILAGSAMPAIL